VNDMLERVLALPEQLAWGERLTVPSLPDDRPVVLLGMGGSAMAAAAGSLLAAGPRPVVVHRDYGLPGWAADAGALVIAVSYSGNTEETLSGFEEAVDRGLPVAAVTSGGRIGAVAESCRLPAIVVPGGFQPRAALGFQVAAVLRLLEGAGLVGDVAGALGEAARETERSLGGGDGPAVALGRDLAEALAGRIAVVYGGRPVGSLAAYRWKTQLNENAKAPAYAAELPEADHNEIQGWRPGGVASCVGVVFLRDRHDHPRVARRLELTAEILRGDVPQLGAAWSSGEGPLARFLTLALVGDVASVALAERTGVDPTPVPVLERFKETLRREHP